MRVDLKDVLSGVRTSFVGVFTRKSKRALGDKRSFCKGVEANQTAVRPGCCVLRRRWWRRRSRFGRRGERCCSVKTHRGCRARRRTVKSVYCWRRGAPGLHSSEEEEEEEEAEGEVVGRPVAITQQTSFSVLVVVGIVWFYERRKARGTKVKLRREWRSTKVRRARSAHTNPTLGLFFWVTCILQENQNKRLRQQSLIVLPCFHVFLPAAHLPTKVLTLERTLRRPPMPVNVLIPRCLPLPSGLC